MSPYREPAPRPDPYEDGEERYARELRAALENGDALSDLAVAAGAGVGVFLFELLSLVAFG